MICTNILQKPLRPKDTDSHNSINHLSKAIINHQCRTNSTEATNSKATASHPRASTVRLHLTSTAAHPKVNMVPHRAMLLRLAPHQDNINNHHRVSMARPQDPLQAIMVRRLKDNMARPRGLPQDSTVLPHRKASSARPSRVTAAHQRSPRLDMDSKWPTWT